MSNVSRLRRPAPAAVDPVLLSGAGPDAPAIAPADPTPTVRIEPFREVLPDASATTGTEGVLVDVVVLTADLDLFKAARQAVGERNPVWRARSADEAADLLITGRCGVLLVDLSSVSSRGDTLVHQIVEQFPEVVVCVAGTQDDEPLLAPLISDGLIYRFMHKPCSPRRAGMFLQAAIRRHAEQREGRGTGDPLLPLLRKLARPSTGLPRRYFVALAVMALALVSALFVGGRPAVGPATTTPTTRTPATAAAPAAAAITDASRRADPVLARARAALQAERLEAPEGRNALDLFQAVLLAEPTNTEARQGLARTLELLLAKADQSAAAGRRIEAEHYTQRVLAASPEDPRAVALMRRLNPPDTPSQQLEREQVAAVRAQVDAAAANSTATVTSSRAAATARTPAPATARSSITATSASSTAGRVTASPSRPMAITTTRVDPRAATNAVPVRNTTPYRDPLTPRLVNAPPPTTTSTAATSRPRSRVFGAPISTGLPTAGYVTSAPAVPAAPPPVAVETERLPRNASVVPADQFDRVSSREPVYPPQALRARTRGWVELEFTITATGSVRDIDVVGAEPTGVFDHAASEALAAWRFRPRVVNGQPVAQRSTITMHFDVED